MADLIPGSMQGKICVVTGGTSGIGRVAAVELARLGATVLISGRDEQRGAEVLAAIKQLATGPAADGAAFFPADLSEQASVRHLADRIKARCPKLDVLINNAGTVYAERKLTSDGIERTFATNHLAPFLLTNLLHGQLAAVGGGARVVTVSSGAHEMGRIDFEDLNLERRYRPISAYSNSKLANILFTTELARRWQADGITANCLHPGVVRTNIWSASRGFIRVLVWLMQPFMISAERGAKTITYLAASPEVAAVTGGYFINCRVAGTSARAKDDSLARQLWETSARLTGLA